MKRSRKNKLQTIPLPWENQNQWYFRLFSGSGWKVVLFVTSLVWIVLGFYQKIDHQEKRRVTKQSIQEVRRSVLLFRKEMGRCPSSNEELVHPPKSNARYLRRMPMDGWGNAFLIQCPGYFASQDVEVISAGPSGSFFVDDNL